MLHAIIKNLPKDPKEIYDYALSKSYNSWIDEKGTKENPGEWQRRPSKLTYEEAYALIQPYKPHWVVSFRNEKWLTKNLGEDYWEFGGCNIRDNDYGEVFIWIQVSVEEAEKIFKKFNLEIDWY